MRVQQSVTVDAPAERVWRIVNDPSRHPELWEGVARWEPRSEQTSGCGARYRFHVQVGSAPVGGLVEFVEADEPGDLAWTSVLGIDHRGRWRLRPAGDGRTRVTLRIGYQTPGGVLGLVTDRLSAPLLGRRLQQVLRRLAVLAAQPDTSHPPATGTATAG